MMKRLIIFLLLLVLVGGAGAQTEKPARKPNVIFFLVDDLGWADMGFEGSSFYETPNIDKLARENMHFTQAYAACHVCSPTRGSIISGQYPARTHLTDWLPGRKEYSFQKYQNADHVQHLPYGIPTLPGLLKAAGYHTAIYGKWHLGEDSNSTMRQGFDVHVPDYNVGWPAKSYFSPYQMRGLEGGPDGEYLTDRLTTEALKWIDQNKDHPFFLYLSHFAVHDPIQGRKDLVEKYKKKLAARRQAATGVPFVLEGNPDAANPLSPEQMTALLQDPRYAGYGNLPDRMVKVKQVQDNPEFAAMVEAMDESLGRVMAKLKELGIDDNTIVIYTSDNGGMSAMNIGNPARKLKPGQLDIAYSTSNLPLRGGKGFLYEGGIREPLIVCWPHHTQAGSVSDVPVISTDYLPTILNMVGVPVPKEYPGDGVNLAPLLEKKPDEAAANRALYWHFPQYSNHGAQSPGGAIRYGDYKLLEYFENNKVQLFNLRKDPGEQHDLVASEPAKVKELTAMLHAWRKKVNANMPVPNPKYDPSLKDQWQNWARPADQKMTSDEK